MSVGRGVLRLALRRLRHERGTALVLVACIALPLFLPIAARVLFDAYEGQLVARADETPLVFGARGSRFDLVLGTLYLRETNVPTVPWSAYEDLLARGEGVPIPLHLSFTARGRPLVGTSPEYFELRDLELAAGTRPLRIGDCVLGADVAGRLGLGVGDTLFSDPRELYDIAKPPALELNVVGVLVPAGGPEDDAVLVDVRTTWALEGLLHGHADAETEVDDALVLGRTEDAIVLSQALLEEQRVSSRNLTRFHGHGDPALLPLSSIVFVPRDQKAATLSTTRVDLGGVHQLVAPRAVVDELLAFVLRLRAFLDRLALLIGLVVALLVGLVVVLSLRIRAPELRTLQRIGVGRGALLGLVATEVLLVLAAGTLVAVVATLSLRLVLPDVETLLSR